MTVVQTKREYLIFVTVKISTWKRIECCPARKIQNIKCNVLSRITVSKITRKEKLIFKNQVVALTERPPNLIVASTKIP